LVADKENVGDGITKCEGLGAYRALQEVRGGKEGGGREERRKLTYLSNNRSKRMLLLSQHSTTLSIAKKMMTAPRFLLRPVLEGA